LEQHETSATEAIFDGRPVRSWIRPTSGEITLLAQSQDVISHDYARYLPELNRCFGECRAVGLVNWHQGANAPDRIFCLHTTGDVPSGHFGAADPAVFTALYHALASAARDLPGYSALSEATHWSGTPHRQNPGMIEEFSVPLMDIEIGSTPASWSDAAAHAAMVRALTTFPDYLGAGLPAVVAVGGTHFESAFCAPLAAGAAHGYQLSHILPNQWLNMDDYTGEEGVRRLLTAAGSVRGGVAALVFHDNLKGPLKDAVRGAAAELGIVAFNHKVLRDPVRLAASLRTPIAA
jgi:D-tyrosyl-tRNA(Tyr) deacylase